MPFDDIFLHVRFQAIDDIEKFILILDMGDDTLSLPAVIRFYNERKTDSVRRFEYLFD